MQTWDLSFKTSLFSQKVIGATDVISNVLHPTAEEGVDVKTVINDIITHFIGAGAPTTQNKTPEVEVFKFSEALADIDVSKHFKTVEKFVNKCLVVQNLNRAIGRGLI